jgi:hypothetical protein
MVINIANKNIELDILLLLIPDDFKIVSSLLEFRRLKLNNIARNKDIGKIISKNHGKINTNKIRNCLISTLFSIIYFKNVVDLLNQIKETKEKVIKKK